MKLTLTALLNFLIVISLFAQSDSEEDHNTWVNLENMSNGFGIGETLKEYKVPTNVKIEGSPYLYDEYLEGKIKIGNRTINFKDMRYDIFRDQFEVKLLVNDRYQLKAFDGSTFSQLYVMNSTFCKCDEVIDNLEDLCEVEDFGSYKLITQYSIKVQEGYYNVALDNGNRNSEFIRKETVYLKDENQTQPISRKKDLYDFFSKNEVDKLTSKRKFKDDSEIKRIVSDLTEK